MSRSATPFDPYLTRWELVPDGVPIFTRAARLLPVRRRGGRGAARVLAMDGEALLIERALGSRATP